MFKNEKQSRQGMPLEQGTCLRKQDTIAREWLCLEPRHVLSASFKTMDIAVIFIPFFTQLLFGCYVGCYLITSQCMISFGQQFGCRGQLRLSSF